MLKRRARPLVPSPTRRRLASREGALITSFALPRPLHQQAMMAAVRLNWTFAEVARAAVAEWLDRHGSGPTTTERGGRR